MSQSNQEVLLEVKGLRIEGRSGDEWNEIVHGIDLTLHKGEVLGLIGESGAGKSTIGLAAMGFTRDGCRISGGSVKYEGEELVNGNPEALRKLRGSSIAYVAQSAAASFNPAHKLIEQTIETPLQHSVMSRADAERDAIALYTRIRLPNPDEIGFRYPHQVSGGQLQRAMTAMAMTCRPNLIVFDEPTTALDVTTQIEVLAAIRDAVEQFNTAAIYITHDLAVVAQMADRIMVLRYGDLVEGSDTRSMLSDPKEDYTKSLWAVRSFQKAEPFQHKEGMTPIIEIKNVDAAYGDVPVLFDVSFKVYEKQTVAVVGESGSGKSTTARCITGLLPPTTGEVFYRGEKLAAATKSRPRDQLRHMQMIYQMPDTALNPKSRIRDIIGRPLTFYLGMTGKQKTERIRALLDEIELEPDQFIDRLPSELSGGQKQRICIARAMAAEPSLIICDEVTSALDQLVAEGILRLLDRLQREFGLAYMFITHDLATVRAIADEVVVMKQGKVVESGEKNEIFKPPHDPYTDLLLSSVPEMDPDWLTQLLADRAAKGMAFEQSSGN